MMKRIVRSLLIALAAAPASAYACTTLCVRGGGAVLVAKNYDWDIGDGELVLNKRGAAKTTLAAINPARWVSRYGSITFNQYGRELPAGGINEAGLVVELMWLDATRYPTDPALPGIGCLEWIQYQLDTAANVAEVARNAAALRIEDDARLHYLACDRSGECAAIEYLGGQLVVHSGATLPIPALTNDTYADSVRTAAGYVAFGGRSPTPLGMGSLERFVRGATLAKGFAHVSPDADVAFGFGLLDAVAQGVYTQWSLVYDLRAGEVSFRTRGDRNVGRLDFKDLDLDCATPALVLDLRDPRRSDVARALSEYTREGNRDLVFRSFRGTPFLASLPDAILERIARLPETSTCTIVGSTTGRH